MSEKNAVAREEECIAPIIGANLYAYQDNELPPDETRAFEQHLLACEACSQKNVITAKIFCTLQEMLWAGELRSDDAADGTRETSNVVLGEV